MGVQAQKGSLRHKSRRLKIVIEKNEVPSGGCRDGRKVGLGGGQQGLPGWQKGTFIRSCLGIREATERRF